jgi:Ca2+-binding RTX toxin-like protein
MSFSIVFDYRFDESGFYTPDVRRALESAAAIWQDIILDEFDDIAPGHQFEISDPETGEDVVLILDDAIDDLLIFVGSRDSLSGNTLGRGGYDSGSGASVFTRRTQFSDFEPYIGEIYVDRSENWFFDQTPDTDDDIPLDSHDFITVALHEIGHVLGIGTAPISGQLTAGGKLSGFNVQRLVEYYSDYDSIPVEQDGVHFEEGILGDTTLMDPTLTSGARTVPSALDRAWLADIGYHIADFNGISYEQQGGQPSLVTGADDRFYGTVLADQIDALAGNDELSGNEGNDHLNGGDGDDQLWGGVGNDSLGGDSGNDSLSGGEDDDWLDGGDGDDQLWGGVGDDYLWGRGGHDSLDGDEGDDRISGGLGNDSLWGNQGADFLIGDDGNDQLSGQEDDDRMDGGADDDKLWGGSGSDYLWGGDGNDYLQGDEGGDILIGWRGDDSLWGKDGADTFVFALNHGRDTVNDFDFSGDILELDPGLGFDDAADVFARIQIDKPFSNVSRVVFDSENYVDIFHDSMLGSPLAAQHFRVSADSLRGRFDFNLSTTEIKSDIVSGTTIADIVLDAPILRDSVSFELVNGDGDNGNEHFLIDQWSLVMSTKPISDNSSPQSIRLRAYASDGFSIEKAITLNIEESSDTAANADRLDITGDGGIDIVDGLLVMRYLFGTFPATSLTDGIAGHVDLNHEEVQTRLDPIISYKDSAGTGLLFDLNSDAKVDPLVDGLLLTHYISHQLSHSDSGGKSWVLPSFAMSQHGEDETRLRLHDLTGL